MKLTELVTTPKGRKATAKLAWDLSKIAGKVAVAGTISFAEYVIHAITSRPASNHDIEALRRSINSFGRSSDGFETFSDRRSTFEKNSDQ
ncbi:hypothetical protein [Halomonas dongshanensis]|uniref:Uncharacterized protein n=1 Tax=Halomonas dongshanensis TaxID=2890835 RepID=A0ABT2EHK4_9GAMM|nr:hypothetical protein [Halomonas dongshanensis]MCS2611025.1 hypothetical protein [Halomonas dongshanensis]